MRRLTKRSEGSNPIWNEQLSIPVKVPGKEVTAESVAGLDESIKVSLFDQRATDISNGREGSEEGEVTRFSNHYLGSTHIPFQSFYRYLMLQCIPLHVVACWNSSCLIVL